MKNGGFSLIQRNDSLYALTLQTDSTNDQWMLPYPVYHFCTGDVDSDGSIDAMVGVEIDGYLYPPQQQGLHGESHHNKRIVPRGDDSDYDSQMCAWETLKTPQPRTQFQHHLIMIGE